MILNVYTIIMLFIAIITGLLAIPLGILAFNIYKKWTGALYDEERTAIEDRSYLLMLIATVMLFIKLLSWPFFYVTLQSYIPSIQGAMCIFGVTGNQPAVSVVTQIFKPVVFFVIGVWLILNHLDRKTETSPLFKRKFLFLSIVSLFVFSDSAIDIFYFTGFNIKVFVSCCTTFFDLPERMTAAIPVSLLGEGYARYLFPLYYFSNSVFIVSQLVVYYRLRKRAMSGQDPLKILVTGVILALINAIVTVFAMFEVIAPDVMEMPLHHCIYCMWQYAPHSILMTALFIFGTFSPGWALILYMAGRHGETGAILNKYLKNLSIVGFVGIGLSVIMATAHLLL